jgi:hypothetical protein
MIISFDIPNAKLTRILTSLEFKGYGFNPDLGTTDQQQRIAFFKSMTVDFWKETTYQSELYTAVRNAQTATTSPDLTDIK